MKPRKWKAEKKLVTVRERDEKALINETSDDNIYKAAGKKRAKNFFISLVENAPDTITLTDRHGKMIYLNAAHKKITGAKIGEYAPDYYEGGVNEAKKIMKMLYENKGMILNYETTLKSRDGKIVPVLLSAVQLKDKKGNVTATYGIGKDITDRKKMEAQLREKERLASIGEISAGLAHELRNPLMAISTAVGVLKKSFSPSKENKNLLNVIIEELSNLNKIVNNFLQLCRVEKLELKSNKEIKKIMDNIITYLQEINKISSKIKIKKNYESLNSKIQIDSSQITQALSNVIMNALEAMPRGGELTIKIKETKEKLIIEITDTGKGINSDELDKIFNLFYTTKPSGIGLGLSLVKKFVINHHGEISVKSNPKSGTTFAVKLPVIQDRNPAAYPPLETVSPFDTLRVNG